MKIPKISGIYIITNLIDNKVYVGYSENIAKRLTMHKSNLRGNYHVNNHLQHAFNKYGEKNFIFELLEEYSKEFLISMENWWVNMLHSFDRSYGYNIQPTGNDKVRTFSKETREKMSISMLKRGVPPLMRINSVLATSKPVLQYTLEGNFVKEWKSITSAIGFNKGEICSVCKFKKKSSKGFIWRYKESENFPTKINAYSSNLEKSVIQFDLSKNKIAEFKSIKIASEKTGVNKQTIWGSCNNKSKIGGGFLWCYKGEEQKIINMDLKRKNSKLKEKL
jgi:group I intron endonuclease